MLQQSHEAPSPGQSGLLHVASYNIHRCVGARGQMNPERVAAVIRELGCDPVGLQEVDNRPGPTPASMQLDYLAGETGLLPVAGMAIIRHTGEYGNALLTNRRVLAVRRHDISFRRREPRGALEVELMVDAAAVSFIVTHLGLTPGERRHQIRKILAVIAALPPGQPVVLMGDINEWWPIGRPLRWMHAVFGEPPAVRSFPARRPLLALDRIWVRPQRALQSLTAHQSRLARQASDHLPVKALIQIGEI